MVLYMYLCIEKPVSPVYFDLESSGYSTELKPDFFYYNQKRRIEMSSTPQHCPGFQDFKDLKSFLCACPECGKEKEIFSDEFDRQHTCSNCNAQIDFTQCKPEGQAGTSESA
jgi:hypothetical protein